MLGVDSEVARMGRTRGVERGVFEVRMMGAVGVRIQMGRLWREVRIVLSFGG